MRRRLVGLCLFAFVLLPLPAHAAPDAFEAIRKMGEGPPHHSDTLPAESYAEVEARNIPGAKLVWFNVERLAELGLPFPRGGKITPEFERAVIDAFAYAIPQKGEPRGFYGSKKKTLYADRYGGHYVGEYRGSGRRASVGDVSIKGTNLTPLKWDSRPAHHKGTESLAGALVETIWSKVFDNALPVGAGQPLFIIARGDKNDYGPAVLVVGEDPLRVGHFVSNRAEDPHIDNARVQGARRNLKKVLPKPEGPVPAAWRKFSMGPELYAHVERIAAQHATAVAMRLFHGSPSESNTLIDGRFIDFSTASTNRGFGPIKVLDFVDPFGDMDGVYEMLVHAPFHHVTSKWRPKDGVNPPNVHDHFQRIFRDTRDVLMLSLTGVPEGLSKRLYETGPQAKELAAVLQRMALEGTRRVNVREQDMPRRVGAYDVPAILRAAAKVKERSGPALDEALSALIPGRRARTDFLGAYRGFVDAAERMSGLAPQHFATLVALRADLENQNSPALYQRRLKHDSPAVATEFARTGDTSKIWDFIERRVDSARRRFDHVADHEVVVWFSHDARHSVVHRLLFDARTGTYHREVVASPQGGHVFLGEKWVPQPEVNRLRMRLGRSAGAKARVAGDVVIFRQEVGPRPGRRGKLSFETGRGLRSSTTRGRPERGELSREGALRARLRERGPVRARRTPRIHGR